MRHLAYLTFCILITTRTFAQIDSSLIDWQRKDLASDQFAGVSAVRALEVLKGRKPHKVVVAIIDSGVDIDQEDLKDNIWVNEDEVAGNGIDDDKNGYVDDVHGWNFLGNASGTDLDNANLELTRIFRKLQPRFNDVRSSKEVDKDDRQDYALFTEVKEKITQELKNTGKEFAQMDAFAKIYDQADSAAIAAFGDAYSVDDVSGWDSDSEEIQLYQKILSGVMQDPNFTKEELDKYLKYLSDKLNYHYNPQYDDRAFIGDDPDNVDEHLYGNNDVSAPHNDHGTHVSGIVGAINGNEIGMDGICPNVKLMIVRAVPNGDEFDKDVANAIRYAADNGANIINMSFGKAYSTHADEVHRAIKHAEDLGVLMVHAAGNDALNLDKVDNFPNPFYETQKAPCSTWLTVGASSPSADEQLPAPFSNYGKKNVDLFAPGVQIYSTKPDNKYEFEDGTSMAAPVTSGVAALIKSYFPEITAVQLKDLLLKSVSPFKKLSVRMPNANNAATKDKKFKVLSRTGGVVNAYNAVQLALTLYP